MELFVKGNNIIKSDKCTCSNCASLLKHSYEGIHVLVYVFHKKGKIRNINLSKLPLIS